MTPARVRGDAEGGRRRLRPGWNGSGRALRGPPVSPARRPVPRSLRGGRGARVVAGAAPADAQPDLVEHPLGDDAERIGRQRLEAQAQISPGSYQVIVNNDIPDISDTDHMFHFSGPGVILLTDMGAGDNKTEAYTETLVPNATYVFQDDRQPGDRPDSHRHVSHCLGHRLDRFDRGRLDLGTAGRAPTRARRRRRTRASSPGTSSPAAFRGSLTGVVSSGGKVLLTKNGKPVTQLEAGRYKISVTDKAPPEASRSRRSAPRRTRSRARASSAGTPPR